MTLHPDFHSASPKETPSCRCLGSQELTEAVLGTNWNEELSIRIASFFSHHHSLQVQYFASQTDPTGALHVQVSHV